MSRGLFLAPFNSIKISQLLMLTTFLASQPAIAQNTPPTQPGQSPGYGQQSQAPAIPLGNRPPANFPAPLYSSNIKSMNFMRAASSADRVSGTIVTSDPVGTACKWYQNALAAGRWTIDQSQSNPTGDLMSFSASNSATKLTIRFMSLGKSPQTLIMISCVPNH